MDFTACFHASRTILMEGALGERLKREFGLSFDKDVAMASLVRKDAGRAALSSLWNGYADVARKYGLPFIAATPTRRANRSRVEQSGYGAELIFDNVAFLDGIRKNSGIQMYVGGLMGCKGDAYSGEGALSEEEALAFHAWQADLFRRAGADFLYAAILPVLPEAIGMAKAMSRAGLPYLISFMIGPDGRLPDKTSIHDAIAQIDRSAERKPLCYMTNCVHPAVLNEALHCACNQTAVVRRRFCGIQANTSRLPPDKLDGSAELMTTDAAALAREMKLLTKSIRMKIVGGCCGTDQTHIEAIAKAFAEP